MPEASEPDAEETGTRPAPHLVPLIDGWTLWRTICLRGTGFPIDMLETLAAHDAAAAIDGFLDCETAWDEARERALAWCRDATETLGTEARKPYRRANRRLTKGRVPEPIPDAPEAASLFEAMALAAEKRDAAGRRAADCLAEARPRISASLLEVCHTPLFREAIIWQNRQVLHTGIDVLTRMGKDAPAWRRRKHEELVFNYLQRYCAKNDSIGFFGPVGWARFADRGPAITVEPGPTLLAKRYLHFEYWAIDAVADVLSRDRDLLPWLAPRLNPFCHLEDGWLHAPGREPERLDAGVARLLAACDGETQAAAIAARFAADPASEFRSELDVLKGLAELAIKSAIYWNAHVPVTPSAERSLRRVLERIRDPAVRARGLASLAELETGQAAVEAARGDPQALDAAMADLEARFQRVTSKDPTRYGGKVYAGRTLVYEDCRRDVDVALGPEIHRRLGPPLALVLRSASWYVHTVGTRFDEYLETLFAKLQNDSAGAPVRFDSMLSRNPAIGKVTAAIVEDVVREHQRRWISILDFDEDARRVQFTAADVGERVSESFPRSPPPWPVARYHSPDMMIAADSAEDIRQGRFLFVLGEVHVGANTVLQPVLTVLHPRPNDIMGYIAHDLGRPLVLPVTGRHHSGARVAPGTVSPDDYHLAANDAPSWRPGDRVLPVGDLVVEQSDEGLVVRSRDGTRRFHMTEFCRMFIAYTSVRGFSMLPAAAHRPRITIDQFVLSREQWSFPCADVPFARLRGTEERFIAARRWIRDHGIPRWAFVRVPFEMKPVYVDFASPVSVDALAKLIRRGAKEDAATPVTVSEMLPTPRQCWLTDAQGNRYASELRIVALNPESWRPSGPGTRQNH